MVGDKGTKRLNNATNLPSKILPEALKLYDEIVDKDKEVRRLGYDFAALMSDEYEQGDLLTDFTKQKKEKKLLNSVLDIKEKFGKNAILRGIDLHEKATQRERNEQVGGHKGGES